MVGVLHTATLGIHAIGLGLAEATGKDPKYATKQFDRLLSNKGLDLPIIFRSWAPFLVRERQEVVVALDWTDHDADDQTTCVLSLVTDHGRTRPRLAGGKSSAARRADRGCPGRHCYRRRRSVSDEHPRRTEDRAEDHRAIPRRHARPQQISAGHRDRSFEVLAAGGDA